MASEHHVRQYLAYWFQLGKPVLIQGGQSETLPCPVLQGDCYSPEFEACWQTILSPESGDCFLDGTPQTIAELLTPAWEINPCSRCTMPVPIRTLGISPVECPCNDIPDWPNTEIPQPHGPINSQHSLLRIRDRLRQVSN